MACPQSFADVSWIDRGLSCAVDTIGGARGAVPPHHKESPVKLHHRLVLLPFLALGPAFLAACGSSGSNSPQQQPSASTMAPHTTDAMAPHTTDAMMPHTTDAMAPSTTGG